MRTGRVGGGRGGRGEQWPAGPPRRRRPPGGRGGGEQQGTMTAVSTAASPSPRRSGFRSWPRWGRWSTYAAVVVVLLLVAGLVAAVVVVRQSFPETEGEIAVPGLAGKVTVLRDHWGIPQVYAGTSHDLFYAQGYTQAQD